MFWGTKSVFTPFDFIPGERSTIAEKMAISSSVRFNLLNRSAKSNIESSRKPALLVA